MTHKIELDSSEIVYVEKKFKGQLDNGHKFEILANWNPKCGWAVNDIFFERNFSEMVDTKISISENFLSAMNDSE